MNFVLEYKYCCFSSVTLFSFFIASIFKAWDSTLIYLNSYKSFGNRNYFCCNFHDNVNNDNADKQLFLFNIFQVTFTTNCKFIPVMLSMTSLTMVNS